MQSLDENHSAGLMSFLPEQETSRVWISEPWRGRWQHPWEQGGWVLLGQGCTPHTPHHPKATYFLIRNNLSKV